MRETKMTKIARRRRARSLRDGKAVSPVVATLILILVAVAAAAALYLWLVAWQGQVTGNVGQPTPLATITIGGSTSVYPFDQFAVAQFQQNNTNIVVSNNQGGSGAGMLAVCSGAVQIGATSSLQTPTNLETNFGCPSGSTQAPVVKTVAYDGVDLITPVANPHGLVSVNASVLLGIYLVQSSSAPTTAMPAYLTASGWVAGAQNLKWNDVPQTSGCLTSGQLLPPTGTAVTDGCAVDTSATAGNAVQTVQRSDNSGTTQSFTARLLGISGTAQLTSLTSLLNNWGGCGSDGQLSSCGISATISSEGNPGVIASVASHPDSIGYASDGLVRVATSGVSCQGVTSGAACGIAFAGVGQTTAIQPSLGTSGTIASSIVKGMTATTGYAGWRPFQWVTLGNPTGEVSQLLTFVLDPYNNFNFATEANEISIYSV